jgi:hypothetical protein
MVLYLCLGAVHLGQFYVDALIPAPFLNVAESYRKQSDTMIHRGLCLRYQPKLSRIHDRPVGAKEHNST